MSKGEEQTHCVNQKTIKFQKEFALNCKNMNECSVIEPVNKSRSSISVASNKKKWSPLNLHSVKLHNSSTSYPL